MTSGRVSAKRLLPPILLLAAPAAALLLALTAAGLVTFGVAAALAAAVALGAALTLLPHLADAQALIAWLRGEAPAEPPAMRTEMGDELASAIRQTQRAAGRRQAETAARLASTEGMLDGLPDPVLMLDGQRRVVRANHAARRLFGREPTGMDLAGLLRVPGVLEACDRLVAGSAGREVEFSLPLPVERDYRARIEPLPGEGTAVVMALHDLTAVKRVERMRADFVANASHELRTPLASLLGFVETLRGPARDDAEARERFLAIMHEQGTRMARLIEDLLSLSRIEMNEHSQPQGRVDLGGLLATVAETLEMKARTRGVRIVLELPDGLPPVTGEADELAQVFQNLVDNAIKYGAEGSAVEIGATHAAKAPPALARRLPAGVVSVAVRDQGDGIAREHVPRLTERFFRVDTARSRKMGGTGLGLAIVKHIVSRHRGVLAIDSEPGRGSVFTVHLPPHPKER